MISPVYVTLFIPFPFHIFFSRPRNHVGCFLFRSVLRRFFKNDIHLIYRSTQFSSIFSSTIQNLGRIHHPKFGIFSQTPWGSVPICVAFCSDLLRGLSLEVGMDTIPWMISMSSPSPPASGTEKKITHENITGMGWENGESVGLGLMLVNVG